MIIYKTKIGMENSFGILRKPIKILKIKIEKKSKNFYNSK